MTADVLIVGAGISGLIAARSLRERGYSAQLIEKARGVGGRLATQKIGEFGQADLGAQFFTVRTDALRRHVDDWLAKDLVYVWGTGWSDGSVKPTHSDGHPRFAVRGGMNQLANYLAADLDIALDRLVTTIQLEDDNWILRDSDNRTYRGRALLMTPPMPATLDVLSSSDISLHPEDFTQLRRIQFGPCLCGIHEIEGAIEMPEPGAVQNFQNEVYWVADNRAKGISKSTIITSHANAKYSRQNWDASEADIIQELESAVRPYLSPGARIVSTQLKKWRFSVPLTTYPHEYMLARDLPLLAFAGDAFGGRGRVEGAFVSGVSAGYALADALADG